MKPTLLNLAALTLASLLLAGCGIFSSDHDKKKKTHHKSSHDSEQASSKDTPQESPEDFRAVKQPGT